MFGNKAAAQKITETVYHQKMIDRIIEEDKERLQYTPDYCRLAQHTSHLFFIHDDMMQLQTNHDMVKEGSLSGFRPLAYGYTTKKMSFIKKELGLKSFPVALSLRNTDDLPLYMTDEYRIRGEIYAIRPHQIVKLDTHRQNGVQFKRIPVNINVGYRKLLGWYDANGSTKYNHHLANEEMLTVSCQMYVGREEYWKDQLLAGFFDFKPIDIIQEDRLWLKEYYQYSRVR